METGHFYFLNDAYFKDFSDPNLERNKEMVNGALHGRPCFFSFLDEHTQIFWMIPISSQLIKYQKIYLDKISRFGKCDTIVLGDVLGYKKAFLIQNMCPTLPKYISSEYMDRNSALPVRINSELETLVIQKSKIVLALARQGKRVIFPDVLTMETILIRQLQEGR